MAEEKCQRVETLRRRLDKERDSVLRRMEVMDSDKILSDSQDWWKTALAWIGNPPQSPKTINARVSCQDQDKTHPSSMKRSSSPTHPTIHLEEEFLHPNSSRNKLMRSCALR